MPGDKVPIYKITPKGIVMLHEAKSRWTSSLLRRLDNCYRSVENIADDILYTIIEKEKEMKDLESRGMNDETRKRKVEVIDYLKKLVKATPILVDKLHREKYIEIASYYELP